MGRPKKLSPFAAADGLSKGEAFASMSDMQVRSAAYQGLSDGAKYVLLVCKLCRQYHVGHDKDGNSRMISGDPLRFYFNREIQQRYGLGNPNKVRRELIELVEAGFIDVIECNWNQRKKNVYRFSGKWQQMDKGQQIELSQGALTFIAGRKV